MTDKAAHNSADQRERSTIIVEDEVLRHGFTQIPNILLRRNDISPGAKLTYMVLLSYAWQTNSCFPGHERLASDLGVAHRSIVTYLQQLRDRGLIKVERRGLGQTNVYRLPRLSDVSQISRSAKSAHQEVQNLSHQEVPILHPKKDTVEEDSLEKDVSSSNVRKRDLTRVDRDETEETTRMDSAVVERHTSSSTPATAPSAPTHGVSSVGSILARRGANRRLQGNLRGQKGHSDERQQVLAFIKDFATEFRDEAPLSSSVSRAYNLQQRSGIPLEAFCSLMYEARALTQEYTSNIKKRRSGPAGAFGPELNKMPYFFRILEEIVDQRSPARSVPTPAGEPTGRDQRELSSAAAPGQHTPMDPTITRVNENLIEAPRWVSRRPSRRTIAPSAAVATFIKDIAVQSGEHTVAPEDHDQAQLLYTQSGLGEDAFLQVLNVTRMITQSARVRAVGDGMPCFFQALREQLGLEESHAEHGDERP